MICLSIAALFLAPASLAHPASSQNNGFVMMVHGHFEPSPQKTLGLPAPPAQEAAVATSSEGTVILHVIPYSVETSRPALTWDAEDPEALRPVLMVKPESADAFWLEANLDAADRATCVEETTLPGHEGPLDACLAFAIPVEAFGDDAVAAATFELHFELDGVHYLEIYNAVAHVLIHVSMEGGPASFEDADARTRDPSLFVVASAE